MSSVVESGMALMDCRNTTSMQKKDALISPVKMCQQPAIWPPTVKYLPLTSHLSDLHSSL